MNLGEKFRSQIDTISTIAAGIAAAVFLALTPQAAIAQDAPAAEVVAAPAADAAVVPAADAASTYTPLGPEMIKGQPSGGTAWNIQQQYSPVGHQAVGFHHFLEWVMLIISVFVLLLLLWVIVRYNKRANPVPSKTSHNTTLEVLWTAVPVLILVAIALPSVNLLLKQYESPPKDALTIKATGYQWYWGYSYPDNGDFEIVSNMMPEEEAHAKGLPGHLAVDNRMVVPVGVPIRLQTFGADVIHSFAVPSLWFKLDAVPGQINEKVMQVDEPGIYYGQCSELCGARHGYMPIAVEAVPMEQFKAWVRLQGGTVPGDEAPAPAADAAAPEAAPSEA